MHFCKYENNEEGNNHEQLNPVPGALAPDTKQYLLKTIHRHTTHYSQWYNDSRNLNLMMYIFLLLRFKT